MASDLDGGSSDNCPDFTLSINPATLDCTNLGENTVILTVSDATDRRDSCAAIVTVLGEDEDCDGVADECDQCPSGDDKVDNNGNNIPDCTEVLPIDQIIESWRCGPALDSVFVCSIAGTDTITAQTLCVSPAEIQNILNAGGYVGPCGNTPCGTITSTSTLSRAAYSIRLYPNPASDQVIIQLPGLPLQAVQLTLYNNYGQIIKSQKLVSTGKEQVNWLIGEIPSGVYLVSLEKQGVHLAKHKLVILE